MANFRLKEATNHYKANLSEDLGLDAWDINQLIFLVEKQFNIQFETGIEKSIVSLNQIASLTYKAMHRQTGSMKVA
ncbi:MAG: acyl carrier protein [Bacteroidales bacterium]|nr:acyl carrier protein [Bacteroidales bacterium]MDD3891882.1 acyl carrier protein [Bacteroidales bacterium]